MRITKILALVVILLVMFSGCESDKNPVIPEKSIQPGYPLTVGNEWQYTRTYELPEIYLEIDTNLTDNVFTSNISKKIIAYDVLYDSVETCIMQETYTEDSLVITSKTWYANANSGLHCYAYRQASTLFFKQSPVNKIMFAGRYFNSVRQVSDFIVKAAPLNKVTIDSMIYEEPPLIALQYPLETSTQWTYLIDTSPWMKIEKKVIGQELVEVPAGKFMCSKIQWLYEYAPGHDGFGDIELYDYVCEKGLIKRSITYTNVFKLTTVDNKVITIAEPTIDETVLTGLSLK